MKGMRNIAPFGLRMPDELREAVAERAKQNGRSMNSEIIQILEDAMNEKRVKEVQIATGNGESIVIDTNDIDSFVTGLKAFADAIASNKIKPTK